MENTNKVALGVVLGILFLFSFGCLGNGTDNGIDQAGAAQNTEQGMMYSPAEQTAVNTQQAENNDVKVEVFTFRGNTECHSCITLGKLTKNTVNKYFADELESGKLTYEHLNVQSPENRDIAVEYQVTAVSLQIGTTIDGVKTRENLQQVWYYLEDEQGFENYLVPILQKRLRGELN